MKQLYIFKQITNESGSSYRQNGMHYWKLFIDGAARNNPGLAGAGVYILKDDQPFEKKGFFLGSKTNNQAEYLALLLGLIFLKQYIQSGDLVLVVSDSELLVKQIKGIYKVKNSALKPLNMAAKKLLIGIDYDIAHVMRENNTQADALANQGIDDRIRIPQEFLAILERHEISL